jgi:uncharacterized membrane protein
MTGTRVSLVCVLMLLGLAGCGSDGTPSGGDASVDMRERSRSSGPSQAICPDDSTLTYETFGREFLETYCTRCHDSSRPAGERNGAPPTVNFDTAELARTHRLAIDAVAAAGPDRINIFMPLGTPAPSDAERDLLGEWLACGAP